MYLLKINQMSYQKKKKKKKTGAIRTKELTKDLINGYTILNRARYFSLRTSKNHLVYFSYKKIY